MRFHTLLTSRSFSGLGKSPHAPTLPRGSAQPHVCIPTQERGNEGREGVRAGWRGSGGNELLAPAALLE